MKGDLITKDLFLEALQCPTIAYLPKELQDYILLHELCHIRHKNHSKKFWAELDKYVDGRSKELRKELKGCRMRMRG